MTYTDESLRKLVSLAGAVLGQDDLRSTLRQVTAIAVDTLPDCDGASLTTFEKGRPLVAAADSEWSSQLDELQYEEREGPCLDATRTGNVFRIRDLSNESRWPFYCKRASDLGARSVVSLPTMSEGKVVGALDVYSRTPDAFDAEQVSLGELMAAQAGVAMQVAASFFRHRDLAEQMRAALESRARIEQAKGVLVATRRCSPEAAFEALVQLSQTSNRKLRDVAEDVVRSAQQPG